MRVDRSLALFRFVLVTLVILAGALIVADTLRRPPVTVVCDLDELGQPAALPTERDGAYLISRLTCGPTPVVLIWHD